MLLKITGLIFVGLAILGIVLPVLPTTPFLLVAAACFAKSSPYLHKKLLANAIFGPLIRDWQAYRSIPRKGKVIALTSMFLAAAWSCYVVENKYVAGGAILLMLAPAIFIWRMPFTEHKKSD